MPLTDRQRALLQLISQLNQNLISDTLGLVDFDLDLGLDLGISLGGNNGNTPSPDNEPGTPPSTITELLSSLVNELVEITTPFGTITGTLLQVLDDYIVMLENTGDRVLARIDKIELVNEL